MENQTYTRNEFLTQRGLIWLKVDICNTYAAPQSGVGSTSTDKLLQHEQIAWVDANFSQLMMFMPNAEEPTRYRSAVGALYDHYNGKKVSHAMYVDASNQGLQLYAILTRCQDTAKLCNLSTKNERQDAYTMIADELNLVFGTELFKRSNCKKALMTKLYGSEKADAMIMNAMFGTNKDDDEAILQKLNEFSIQLGITEFNEDFLKVAFDDVMIKIAPSAMSAMTAIQSLNKLGRPFYSWTLPDGFVVDYWVKKDVKTTRALTIEGITQEYTVVCNDVYMPDEDSKAMAPNLIHSVDGYIARQLIIRLQEWCTTTHDAFASHVNDIDRLITIYKDIMIEILNSNLLQDLMTQIMSDGSLLPAINYANTLTEQDIRESLYGLY